MTPAVAGVRRIELPRYLRVVEDGGGLVDPLRVLIGEVGLHRPLVVSGATRSAAVAGDLARALGLRHATIGDNSRARVGSLAAELSEHDHDGIVALGGGRPIDVAKAACQVADLSVVVVPTQLTADGIASPIAVIGDAAVGDDPAIHSSERARLPVAVLADLNLLAAAPPGATRAGFGDLIANRTALADWRIAAAHGHDELDDFAALLADAAYRLVEGVDLADLRSGEITTEFARRLLEGLVMSGIAMEAAGSSRPCSGAEHLISHALDRLAPGTAAHGEQVAFGTLLVTHLQGDDWTPVRRLLIDSGLDAAAAGFGLPTDLLTQVVRAAPATRPARFTVLDTIDLDSPALAEAIDTVRA